MVAASGVLACSPSLEKRLRFAGFLRGQSPHGLSRIWSTWAGPACLETRLSKDPPSQTCSETAGLLSLHVQKTCAPEPRGPQLALTSCAAAPVSTAARSRGTVPDKPD